jgi:large subunit ribosomal protein L21
MNKMYAIIETGGKQYKVAVGDFIYAEKLDVEDGAKVEFKVIAVADDSGITTGTPYLEKAKVIGEAVKTGKGKKITVFTYKPKKSVKRKQGHRQPFTKVEIKEIKK